MEREWREQREQSCIGAATIAVAARYMRHKRIGMHVTRVHTRVQKGK